LTDTDVLDLSVDEVLTTTRTVRRRLDLDRPVPRSVVEECLNLAFQAPNGDNSQPWAWVMVDDPGTKAAMGDIYRAGITEVFEMLRSNSEAGREQLDRLGFEVAMDATTKRIYDSVAHLNTHIQDVPVLVVGAMSGRIEGKTLFETASMWGSVLPAAWSFMLALRSRGLGSAWTTAHLQLETQMADLLGIPDTMTQVGMFPVAYTIGTDFRPGERSGIGTVTSWNRWDH
jgi:nitroreductase